MVSLMDCLLLSGMSCAPAESLISPVSRGEPAHYISTLYQLGEDSQVSACMVTQGPGNNRGELPGCTMQCLIRAWLGIFLAWIFGLPYLVRCQAKKVRLQCKL